MSFRLLMHGRPLRVEHITTDRQQNRRGPVNNRHRHPVFHVMYITDGEGRFLVNDRLTRALPGHLYIINPNEWHQFHGDETNSLHNLECTFLVRDDTQEPAVVNFFDWFEAKRGMPVPASLREGPIRVPAKLQPFLLEGFNRLLDPGSRYVTEEHRELMVADLLLRTEELLWQLIASQGDRTRERTGAEEVETLKRYMAAHLGESIQLEQLAALVHWSPNYLCRVYKTHTGMTPLAHLQQLRMEAAEKLLLYTDYPVFTVSETVGYEDPSYFARLFRRHRGRAPSDYRKG
ncbi:AraC family transcriptional regulator [Paenibacillus lycopersici]|uniref:AraC family transcriptional regulator n=1 Tax=Paenibacillus lycopersici TaxID=2704462 RepID=A0A6C0FSV7_9BACL|nr:AraC family transcriptional regulator [Paenibacillus lycopersici]QHT60228.1 AraC family transcriptional regulator [Paenibacillus lycopersici]